MLYPLRPVHKYVCELQVHDFLKIINRCVQVDGFFFSFFSLIMYRLLLGTLCVHDALISVSHRVSQLFKTMIHKRRRKKKKKKWSHDVNWLKFINYGPLLLSYHGILELYLFFSLDALFLSIHFFSLISNKRKKNVPFVWRFQALPFLTMPLIFNLILGLVLPFSCNSLTALEFNHFFFSSASFF